MELKYEFFVVFFQVDEKKNHITTEKYCQHFFALCLIQQFCQLYRNIQG